MALGGHIVSTRNASSTDQELRDLYLGANHWLDLHWKVPLPTVATIAL